MEQPFHLARLVTVFNDGVVWGYSVSPRLGAALDVHRTGAPGERLVALRPGERGTYTVSDVQAVRDDEAAYRAAIHAWARSVHAAWVSEHKNVLSVVQRFLATRF